MTKNKVLEILRQARDYVSGQQISEEIGVSRAAINKAVKSLQAEGYDILSVTNKGYCLMNAPDHLTGKEIAAYLPSGRMEQVLCFDTIGSTNDHLRTMAMDGAADGQVVIANEQTKGRGRRGRDFLSLKDKGIYFSVLLRPQCLPTDVVEITSWTAVAISRAIYKVCGVRPGIKWVNDLILDQKKICGILTEMSIESETGYVQYVIVGIGINVNQKPEDFPEELRDIATSLAQATGSEIKRAQLAAAMVEEMDRLREAYPAGKESFLQEYRDHNITIGRDINVITPVSTKAAHALSVNDDFSLNVRYEDGSQESLSSGEVSIRYR